MFSLRISLFIELKEYFFLNLNVLFHFYTFNTAEAKLKLKPIV